MKQRHRSFWTMFVLGSVLLGALALAASSAGAVSNKPADPNEEWDIDDQPGVEPPAGSETLTGPWERQLVFFRTNESPGTIVVHTAEKHLYLVQGITAQSATASASAGRASSGRASSASSASRNGRIGGRRRR